MDNVGYRSWVPASNHAPLFGRDAELRRVAEVLDLAGSGGVAVGLIEGEAGIGKSRLLAEARREATARGFRVWYGRAEELEADRPFVALLEALGCRSSSPDPARAALADRLVDRGTQFRVQEELIDLIEASALEGPLLLALEDLQWADDGTLAALIASTRRLSHLPIAVIATLRPVPRTAALARTLDALTRDRALHLVLGPLPPEAVSELVSATLGARPGVNLREQLDGAGGNPLFVTELLQALVQEEAVHIADGIADVAVVSLPPNVRLTILRRLSYLPEATLETLRVASVLGSSFSPADLSAVIGVSVVDAIARLRAAVSAGILTADGEQLTFRHDLIRESIYDDVPRALRAALHLEAGRAFERTGAPAGRIASHLVAAAIPGDEDSLDLLMRTAWSLSDSAPQLSLVLFDRGIEVMGPNHRRRDEALVGTLRPKILAGRLAEAEALAEELDPRVQDRELRVVIGRAVRLALRRRGRLLELKDLYAVSAASSDARQTASLQGSDATVLLFLGEIDGAATVASQSLSAARSNDDQHTAVSSLFVLAWTAAARGDVAEALDRAAEADRLEIGLGSDRGEDAQLALGIALLEADRLEEAAAAFARARLRDVDAGDPNYITSHHFAMAGKHFFAGEYDDALVDAEIGVGLVEEGAGAALGLLYGLGFDALISLHRGHLSRAERAVEAGERWIESVGPQLGMEFVRCAGALLTEAEGDLRAAYEALARSWDVAAPFRYLLSWRTIAPELLRLALAAGDADRARAVAETAEQGADLARGIASATAAALRCRGLLEDDPSTLVRAVEACRLSPRLVDRATAAEDAAVSLAQAGRGVEARPYFEEALEIFDSVGAARSASRVGAAMRAAGLRRGSRKPQRKASTGWEALTASELGVVRLTVEGLTNPQIAERLFISPHTVRSHLNHVFTKLSVSTRVELATVAARHEPGLVGRR